MFRNRSRGPIFHPTRISQSKKFFYKVQAINFSKNLIFLETINQVEPWNWIFVYVDDRFGRGKWMNFLVWVLFCEKWREKVNCSIDCITLKWREEKSSWSNWTKQGNFWISVPLNSFPIKTNNDIHQNHFKFTLKLDSKLRTVH